MGFLTIFLFLVSALYSVKAGTLSAVANAVTECGSSAVTLVIGMCGAMAVWGGLVNVANESGLSELLTKAMKPLINKIFKGLNRDSKATNAIALNITANLLGLGNAATPLGLSAMKQLEEEERAGDKPTKNMTLLAVINACSLQIIPTTVAALRLSSGSRSPMEILPCVILVSAASLLVALITAEVLEGGR